MALRHSADVAFVLFGGVDIRTDALTKFSDNHEAMLEETHTLGDGWVEQQYTGIRNAELTLEGFYNDSGTASGPVGSIHAALSSGVSATAGRILCYTLEGTATGARFVGWSSAVVNNYARNFNLGGFTKITAQLRTAGEVEQGRVVYTYKAPGATGASTGTPLDNAASSTGGAGYLQYNATAGEANIRLLHSSDNITYAALFTFTKTASGAGSQRVTTSGTIERYTAMDVTTASATGAIAALNLFVGLVRY